MTWASTNFASAAPPPLQPLTRAQDASDITRKRSPAGRPVTALQRPRRRGPSSSQLHRGVHLLHGPSIVSSALLALRVPRCFVPPTPTQPNASCCGAGAMARQSAQLAVLVPPSLLARPAHCCLQLLAPAAAHSPACTPPPPPCKFTHYKLQSFVPGTSKGFAAIIRGAGGGSRGHQEERLGAAFFARRAGARLSSENGWGRRGGRQEGVRNTHHTQECSTNKEGIEGGNFLLWEVGGARIRSDHAVRFGGPVCVALARAACCFLLLRKGRRNFVKGGGKLGRAGHQMRACMCVRAGVRVRGVPLHASVLPALQVPWDQNRLPKARECDAARRSRWRRARCCNPTRPPAAGRRAARRILSSWQ